MPDSSMNLYFTVKDDGTSVLARIGDKTESLDKASQRLNQTYAAMRKAGEPLLRQQVELEKQLAAVGREVKAAEKNFRSLGDAASEDAFVKAKQQQKELQAELKRTKDELKANEAAYRSNAEAIRKGELGGSGAGGNTLQGLMQAGLFKMLGDSVSLAAGVALESIAGQPMAQAISSTLSGATTGYALGGFAGAGIGAIAGGISGATQIFTAQDDAFKAYYREATERALQEQADLISGGSGIAGSREQTFMAFAQRLGGDAAAADYLGRVKTMAGSTNYSFDEITGYSKLLLNSYGAEEAFGVLKSLSDATAGLNLSGSDVGVLISGLSRMRTTGKATSEYLNYFRERGIDADAALAGYLGVEKSGVAGMVSKGQIGGVDAAAAILQYIDQEFGGLSEKLATTYDAMTANLADAEANMQAAAGEGYNEERKRGIAAQQEWLTGNGALEEAYKAIGAWEASLENDKEEFIRKAVDAMMQTEDYRNAVEAGDAAEMGKLIMEAKVHGMNEYNASEGAQLALESELSLAEAIRDDSATDQAYWDAGYRKGQEFSKGIVAARMENKDWLAAFSAANAAGWAAERSGNVSSNAFGLQRVPYNGFPAILHEGERVLTASEARNYGQGGGLIVNVTGNSFTGTGEEMADQIAAILARKLEMAAVAAAPA